MKKIFTLLVLVFAFFMASCSTGTSGNTITPKKDSLSPLQSLIKREITYSQAKSLISGLHLNSKATKQLAGQVQQPKDLTYYLEKFSRIDVTYTISTLDGDTPATYEVRGEVLLSTLQQNSIKLTSSMPEIQYLVIDGGIVDSIQTLEIDWEASDSHYIAPFTNKYVYGETSKFFGLKFKDFISAAGGLSTTETEIQQSYSPYDGTLEKWQFEYWTKSEEFNGTKQISRQIVANFNWIEKDVR
jgi:hypothetical protein